MAYREKAAWLALACLAAAYGLYFGMIARRPPGVMADILTMFGSVSIVPAIAVVAGTVWLAKADEARGADERDRSIARHGATIAYFVLMAGMIVVGVMMPFGSTPWQTVNHALLALGVAEAARQIVVLISYRQGWHG